MDALLIAASSQSTLGKYREAIRNYNTILTSPLDSMEGGLIKRCEALNGLGLAHNALGDLPKAIECHEEHLSIALQWGNKCAQGAALLNLGKAHKALGEYSKALEYHHRSLRISRELGDLSGESLSYANLGNIAKDLGNLDQAIEYHNRHLEIAEALGDLPGQGIAYCNMGGICSDLKDDDGAIRNFKMYLDIARQLEDKPGQCVACGNVAAVYKSAGQYAKALTYASEQLELAEQLDDKAGQERATYILGLAHSALQQHRMAIKFFEQNLEVATELGNVSAKQRAYSELGDAYRALGQHDEAIEYHKLQLDLFDQARSECDPVTPHGDLGWTLARVGRLTEACSHLRIADSIVGEVAAKLGDGDRERILKKWGGKHAHYMDEWVVAAARSGDMMEALRVEEQRRCRLRPAYEADLETETLATQLKAAVASAGASFAIVMKKYDDTLLTWVLSGETGELVYDRMVDIAGRQKAISEWVDCVTFVGWAEWQMAFSKAVSGVQRLRGGRRGVDKPSLTALIQSTIPERIKGDLSEELWASVRDPDTFDKTVTGDSPAFVNLQSHFLQKADVALEQLSALLWEPVVSEYQPLGDFLQAAALGSKPVGGLCASMSRQARAGL